MSDFAVTEFSLNDLDEISICKTEKGTFEVRLSYGDKILSLGEMRLMPLELNLSLSLEGKEFIIKLED